MEEKGRKMLIKKEKEGERRGKVKKIRKRQIIKSISTEEKEEEKEDKKHISRNRRRRLGGKAKENK